jgi:uncharacterized protein YaaQ
MKLLLTVVQDQDAQPLLEALIKGDYRVTKLASTGGFLRSGNTTLLVGIGDEQVDSVLNIIGEVCQPRERPVTPVPPLGGTGEPYVPFPVEVPVGGAAVFVIDVEQFIRI